jgi:hypothetical protein
MRTYAWKPRVRPHRRLACAAALATLVLVVHSIHAQAASIAHHESASAATSDLAFAAPLFTPGEFVDHAGAVAGCMMLEFSAPRAMALTLLGAGLLVLFVTALAAVQTAMGVESVETARPPPAARRQALLGVFLS